CHSSLRHVQLEKLRACGSRADGTVPSLVVQARLHQLEVSVEREPSFHFKSNDVGSENVAARNLPILAEAQYRGQNQHTRVADFYATIVVIQCMGDDAVNQGSILDRNFEIGAEYGRLRRPTELGYITYAGSADRLDHAGEGGSHAVQRRAFRF